MSPISADLPNQDRLLLVKIVATLLLTSIVAIGMIWVMLAPTNQTTTNAAIAILSAISTGWISYLVKS